MLREDRCLMLGGGSGYHMTVAGYLSARRLRVMVDHQSSKNRTKIATHSLP